MCLGRPTPGTPPLPATPQGASSTREEDGIESPWDISRPERKLVASLGLFAEKAHRRENVGN